MMIEFVSSHRISDLKYIPLEYWEFSPSSLQAVHPSECYLFFKWYINWRIQHVTWHALFSLTHFLSQSNRCDFIIDGKEVNKTVIKHSQIAYGSAIEFEMW